MLAQDENIIPIPGTKRIKYLEQNAAAVDIELTSSEVETINEIAPPNAATGTRYPELMMGLLDA